MSNNTAMKVMTLGKCSRSYNHNMRSYFRTIKQDLSKIIAIASCQKTVHTFSLTLNHIKKYRFLIIWKERIDFHNQSKKLFICALIAFLQVQHHNGPPYYYMND